MIRLDDIPRRIRDEKELALEEILGPSLLSRVSRLLNNKLRSDLRLSNCTLSEVGESHVRWSAQIPSVFGFKSIATEFSLFELTSSRTERVRHSIFSIEIPDNASLYEYLSQYIGEPDADSPPGWTAVTPLLVNYFKNIAFAGKRMVFSSIDYTRRENKDAFYPEAYRTLIPASEVKAGLNFLVKVAYSSEIAGFFADVLAKDDRFQVLLEAESPNQAAVVITSERAVSVTVDKGVGVELALGPISVSLEGIRLSVPLVAVERSEVQTALIGSLKLGQEQLVRITGEFYPYYRELAVSFLEFPSLKQVIRLLGDETQDMYFPEPLSSLLSIRLSSVGMTLSLAENSVRAISLSLSTEERITLIENVIRFQPALDMRIYAPFDDRYRVVEGELRGIWQLGTTGFETVLYYPSFDFVARMAPDQSLDVGEVINSILVSIDLPKPETKPAIKLTKMEVRGNFLRKSFSAEIDADDEWKFSLGGRRFGLRISKLRMAYDNRQVSCTLDGALKLAGVDVFILAEYDSDVGWKLSGGTPVGEVVNFTSIANDLLESLSLHTELPELKLTNILFSAAPKNGEYSLGCKAEGDWKLMPGVSLKVDQFRAEKRQGSSVAGLLRAKMTIGESVLWLSAEKAAAANGGWKFEGGSAEGNEIKIGEIVSWVGEKFGGTQLPEAIKEFTVDKLNLSFESESKDFFFTCEGKVTFPGQKTGVQGAVTIDIKHQGKSDCTKLFGGSLTIDGIEFDLIFESSKTTDGVSNWFVAAYHDANGHTIKIDELVNRFLGDTPVKTGLDITLKDALLACQETAKEAKFLFGLDIEGGLNLAELNLPNLPLIGQPFAAGQTLKLALQVLVAGTNTFTVEEIKTLNKLNGKGISLPEQEVTGLKLAALVRVGEETKTLSLPIGLSSEGKGLEDKPVASATNTDQPSSYVRSADGTQWISIQKTFGPIQVERVGIGYQDGKIALLLDAALSAAGLTLSLDGLGAEFSLKDLNDKVFKPTFHLNGLGIDYRSGPLEIGGSFLEQKGKLKVGDKELDYTSYAGLAVIRTAKLTLSAIGSYTQINNRDPSLFIYAVANYALGGPAFFYVTGFAAGFGYNRALILPPIDAIASFPLVAEAVKDGGPASLPTGQKEQQKALTEKLAQLEQYLPPSVGDIFIAAGIKFTSFKQIDSFALLVVKFGRRFEIDLLGLSTLTAPPPEAGQTVAPVAQAQLALKASFIPDEGFLGVRAQLTSNSYIFSKDCHLNGGFAFYTWFEPHRQAGDFVLTLGGYHPKFIVPAHYPQVPRLSLNWQVSPQLHIKADAYFALTGSAIMAGAHLEATWQSGALRAWFNAGADFILAWKPYSYDLELYIGMGVTYTFEAFGNQTLSVDLGANLHLWGPPFSGTATIHWSIISFTVNFGEGAPKRLEKLDWDKFKTAFLPKSEQICSVVVQQGLMRQIEAEGKQPERWVVNQKEMVLAINSAVPFNKVETLADHLRLEGPKLEEKALAIAPMGIESSLESTCSITITGDHGQRLEKPTFEVRPVRKSMPAGLWGKPNLSEDKEYLQLPNLNGPQLVENMLTGFEIRPIKKDQQKAHSCYIDRDELQYKTELVPDAYSWQEFQLSGPPGQSAWDKAATTVVGKRGARDQLLKALGMVNAVIDFGEPVQGVLAAA
jgi:hypothetical protein